MGKYIELEEFGGCGDSLRAQITEDGLYIECDEPWSGDTETGFGRAGAVTLTKEQARRLAAFLLEWADEAQPNAKQEG